MSQRDNLFLLNIGVVLTRTCVLVWGKIDDKRLWDWTVAVTVDRAMMIAHITTAHPTMVKGVAHATFAVHLQASN